MRIMLAWIVIAGAIALGGCATVVGYHRFPTTTGVSGI